MWIAQIFTKPVISLQIIDFKNGVVQPLSTSGQSSLLAYVNVEPFASGIAVNKAEIVIQR